MSHEEASQRVISGLQGVLAQLPASSTTWITQLACVPGCVLMLADIAVGEGYAGGANEPGELEGGIEVTGHNQQQGQQQHTPVYHGGTWRIDVSQRSASNALSFWAFMSISSFEAAGEGGSLLNAFAAVLSQAASQDSDEASRAAEVTAVAEPLAVASWGGTLQLAFQLREGLEQQRRTHGPSSSSGASESGRQSVRVVLVQGQRVLVDQEVLAEVSGMTLSFLLQLPPIIDSLCQSPAAAFYVLPAESVMGAHSSGATAAAVAAAGPLAHLTLLLLPPAICAELLLWVEQLQLSQQQLQPLIEDMAVAVEACGVVAASGPAAAAQLSNAAFVWAQAAASAGRVLSITHTCPQLSLCEDMMAGCYQQLLVALRRVEPLAAGGLPSEDEASQLAATAAEASGLASTSNIITEDAVGLKPEEGVAKEGGKVLGPADWEGASAGKLEGSFTNLRRELEAPCVGEDPAAAAVPSKVWLWWWCVLGSLIGWRDRELEAGYLATRMQQWAVVRPPTWVAMGVIDTISYGVMAVRAACYAYSSVSAPHVVGVFWYVLAQFAVYIAYALWLLLCPASQRHLTGLVAVALECVRLVGSEGYRYFDGGFETYYLLARSATSKPGPTIMACLMTMRIMLHQLPPPWLLLHAAGLVWWVWRLQSNIPGWWPAVSTTAEAWLQPLVFAGLGIASVVSLEAGSRAAYIKSLQGRQ